MFSCLKKFIKNLKQCNFFSYQNLKKIILNIIGIIFMMELFCGFYEFILDWFFDSIFIEKEEEESKNKKKEDDLGGF